MNYEENIKKLILVIPQAPKPVGTYTPVIESGKLGFLSGQVSKTADGKVIQGKVGADLTLEQGREAARVAALNAIGIVQALVGFNRFERILRVVGYVQTAPNFYDISKVIDGASELFEAVFGEAGVHARSAVGMASLPLNAAVEIEVTIKLKDEN